MQSSSGLIALTSSMMPLIWPPFSAASANAARAVASGPLGGGVCFFFDVVPPVDFGRYFVDFLRARLKPKVVISRHAFRASITEPFAADLAVAAS